MEKNYKKELMMKGNSVKRCVKECQSYDKEVNKLQAKYDELKTNNVDEYDIKKADEYLQEAISARNSSRTNLRKWTDELTNLVNEITEEEVKVLEEYKNAIAHLDSAKSIFENNQN